MALEVRTFLLPVSASDPCGPDLDRASDADYMTYMARAEGLLPQSFFAFERSSVDFRAEFALIAGLSARTRDLRLIVLHAKLSILDRDTVAFAEDLAIVAAALEERWDDVHPRRDESGLLERIATVQGLDDLPDCLLPLQYAELFGARRVGPISWRSWLVATGKVAARDGEPSLDVGAIERAALATDLPALVARHRLFVGILSAIGRIDAAFRDRGGVENAVDLGRLRELAGAIADFLEGQIARRVPSVALQRRRGEVEPETPSPAVAVEESAGLHPGFSSRREALCGLAAVRDYFRDHEPNSPTLLLVRYASRLANLPFHDLIRLLMPGLADRASIPVAQSLFRLSLEKVAEALGEGAARKAESVVAPEPEGAAFAVTNRRDALRLLDLVVVWYRACEPTSPLPLILGRAREMAEKDFQTLLTELFSEGALNALKGDEWT